MDDELWLIVFSVSCFWVLYHHFFYPFLLAWMSAGKEPAKPQTYRRGYRETSADFGLPTITIVMPTYNEEACIANKIYNLGLLDYPSDKLFVIIIFDGCTDNTVVRAKAVLQQPENKHLKVSFIEKKDNQGKIAAVNDAVALSESDMIALTDVSAMLSVNSLLVVANLLVNEKNGVVCGRYGFFHDHTDGERAYWRYQGNIKQCESCLGSTLGVHGAFYALRRELFVPLPVDTINEDFSLPAMILEKGFNSIYCPQINTIEAESVSETDDFRRRVRISQGNLQQVLRHWRLLMPRRGMIAFMFFSGKFLRAVMPLFIAMAVIAAFALADDIRLFTFVFVILSTTYGVSLYYLLCGGVPKYRYIRLLCYIASGHIAMTIGCLQYIFWRTPTAWIKLKKDHEE
ncbi:Beta-monoglucosyldiacylglycerol synthase [invertebrate metagenome]|uniref:Beta-monoglucosyldiacylglycerol synthase n=1 Tax=invertebrate metagenome TaxID=1711999 RepID=A0A2H9TCF0_9ZZZZ